MILPTKHIPEEQTLLGVGSVLLQEIKKPHTVTSLWEKVRLNQVVRTFERFVLALDLLHITDIVTISNGMIERTEA